MRLTDMKPFCATLARGNRPQQMICQEMVRRFRVADADIQDRGGILNAATYYADREYVDALSQTPWKAPRTSPTSFVKFLDRKGFVIPWYFQNPSHVNRLVVAAQRAQAECAPQDDPKCMPAAIAGALLMGQRGGWKVRGQLALDRERSPDTVLDERTARCSEWLTALKGAALFVGGDVRGQVIPGGQYHLEVYWALDASADTLWNLKLLEGSNTTHQATVISQSAMRLLSPADIVVSISINRILSSDAGVQKKYAQLKVLQNWGGSDPVREWLRSALEVYANGGS